jgi:uncharacterized membrane protein
MATPANASAGTAGDVAGNLVRPARIQSIDLLRGIIMAIMALDHVRDFFTHLRFQPEDMANTYAGLFFTRWITHFCAPVFFFLAGTGAYFYGRSRTKAEVIRFLWTRGLVLMVMEFTIMWFAWTFRLPGPAVVMIVIWALGLSMVILSLLIRLPLNLLAAFSLIVIAGHNLLDKVTPAMFGKANWLWLILHQQGFYAIGSQPAGPNLPPLGFFVAYPVMPWFAVMGAGYALGAIYAKPAEERRKMLFRIGLVAIVLFCVLRVTNIYGNAAPPQNPQFGLGSEGPFAVQATVEKTVIKFLNVHKYPPSLDFLLMTLGPALIFLSLADKFQFKGLLGKIAHPFHVIGRVPMFYYICHLYLIHVLAIVTALAFGQPYKWLLHGGFFTGPTPQGYGHNLPFIWFIWALTVTILYFPCRWYAQYKATHKAKWLSYI